MISFLFLSLYSSHIKMTLVIRNEDRDIQYETINRIMEIS